MAAALVITCNPVMTKAEEEEEVILEEENEATASTDISYTFTVSSCPELSVFLFVPDMAAGTMELYANDEYIGTDTLTDDDTSWLHGEFLYGHLLSIKDPEPGNWKVVLNFNTDTYFIISVTRKKPLVDISDSEIKLAKGSTQKLSVSGAKGDIIWASNNKSVAKIDSAGKVKAKKAGIAKVTATTADGQVFTCTVSVYKNEYKETKMNSLSVKDGSLQMQVYKMFYDSKGNLVFKIRFVNNTVNKTIKKIKNLTVKAVDGYGKAIGTLKVNNRKITLHPGKHKDLTFVIKKSGLKNKKADLRTAMYSSTRIINCSNNIIK